MSTNPRNLKLAVILKNKICDALTYTNIKEITITYDGSGDSGRVDDIDYDAACHKVEYSKLTQQGRQLIHDLASDLTYNILPGGWETDNGGHGSITIDVKERTAYVDYNEAMTTYNEYEYQINEQDELVIES